MNKKLIRLTEQDLHRIVKESVNKILKEGYFDDPYGLHGKIARSGNGDAESYLRAGWAYDEKSGRWISPEEWARM